MECANPECEAGLPGHVRACLVCGRDAGFPNVRAARGIEEQPVAQARYEAAREASADGGYEDVFRQFELACSSAYAVICMGLSTVLYIVSSDNVLYATYYRQVDAAARIPEENSWDRARESVDSMMFPHYHREISFGALSLTGIGHTAYGPYSIVLKEVAIRDRTSVFHEPLFPFFRSRGIVVGDAVPPGFRATWSDRGRLAAAKHGSQLTAHTDPDDFQDLLLSPGGDTEGDCIEAHVYGPIHRRAIWRVMGTAPRRRADQILVKSLQRKLDEVGAELQLTT